MPSFSDRYLQGFYQQVYDELLQMSEQMLDASVYAEALLVMRAIMKRVRSNLELLVPRLHGVGYHFGKGFWEQFQDLSAEEIEVIQQDIPIFKAPTPDAPERVKLLEQLVGTLPLSLKCWYEEVGSANLVGAFPAFDARDFRGGHGYGLDPLFIYSVEMQIKMVTTYIKGGSWPPGLPLSLSPDCWYKYGYSGSGAYSIRVPCHAIDAPLLLEWHHTTLVNYLRLCFQWGGFPGLEGTNRLSRGEIEFLTKGFLPF